MTSDEALALLRDPGAVHLNMLRGSIAKPSRENILHLYPELRDELLANNAEDISMAKKQKTRSFRQVRGLDEICELARDHYDYHDWCIMTDGIRVWISKQKIGQKRTDHIEVPKKIFDRLFDAYAKQRPLGTWNGERFVVTR